MVFSQEKLSVHPPSPSSWTNFPVIGFYINQFFIYIRLLFWNINKFHSKLLFLPLNNWFEKQFYLYLLWFWNLDIFKSIFIFFFIFKIQRSSIVLQLFRLKTPCVFRFIEGPQRAFAFGAISLDTYTWEFLNCVH